MTSGSLPGVYVTCGYAACVSTTCGYVVTCVIYAFSVLTGIDHETTLDIHHHLTLWFIRGMQVVCISGNWLKRLLV